jgi:hypothetical protein
MSEYERIAELRLTAGLATFGNVDKQYAVFLRLIDEFARSSTEYCRALAIKLSGNSEIPIAQSIDGFEESLFWELVDGRTRSAANVEKGRARLSRDIVAGSVERVEATWASRALAIEWWRTSRAFAGSADTITLSISVGERTQTTRTLYLGGEQIAVWESIARLFVRDLASACDASTAFATLDVEPVPYLAVFGGSESQPALAESVYGYYWLNWIGPEVVKRIGNGERICAVLSEASCEILDNGAVFIALRDRAEDVSDADLRSLRDVVRPALLPRLYAPRYRPGDIRPRVFEDDVKVEPSLAIGFSNRRPARPRPVPFETPNPIDSSGVRFELSFLSSVSVEQRQLVEDIIASWATVGSAGGFSPDLEIPGAFHVVEPCEWGEDARTVFWFADLGRAGEQALDALARLLAHLALSIDVETEALHLSNP